MCATAVRQGCPRSDGQGGIGVVAATPPRTGSTTLEGNAEFDATSYTTGPGNVFSANFHAARLPPGVSTLTRIREPARSTWLNPAIPTRIAGFSHVLRAGSRTQT